MLSGLFIASLQRFRNLMPLAASCSASISALCRILPDGGEDGYEAAYLPLQWGVIPGSKRLSRPRLEGVHYSFSSREVETLESLISSSAKTDDEEKDNSNL
jgi:hypothetical protein